MLTRTTPRFARILAHLFPGKEFATNPLLQLCSENALSLRSYCEGKGHEFIVTSSESDFDSKVSTAEFVITTPTYPIRLDRARLERAKALQVLCTAGVGSDHIDIEAAAVQGITVAEITGANADAYANHVLLMILAALRDAPGNGPLVSSALSEQSKEFNLARATARSLDVYRRAIGVVGCGRVGYRVMMRAAALDCSVNYHDKARLRRELEVHVGSTYYKTPQALAAESDVVVAAVPRTKWTTGMIDENFLRACRAGTLLVNASFHELVNLTALKAALESGHISGYATDCWPNGRPDKALGALPNTMLWPPVGGATLDAQASIASGVLNMVERFTTQRNYPAEYLLAHGGRLVSKSLDAPA